MKYYLMIRDAKQSPIKVGPHLIKTRAAFVCRLRVSAATMVGQVPLAMVAAVYQVEKNPTVPQWRH